MELVPDNKSSKCMLKETILALCGVEPLGQDPSYNVLTLQAAGQHGLDTFRPVFHGAHRCT